MIIRRLWQSATIIALCQGSQVLAQDMETLEKQDELSSSKNPAAIEKISITGSRIKRSSAEGPAPIQVIGKEEIEGSGYNTVSDVLRELPVSTHGSTREISGRGASSASGVNLRGIGEEYTLVLIDGRRLPNDPVLGFVDIGEIPVAMVERVEILKEGASALYGSDAVGGVVNIITRQGFDGSSVLYSRSFTTEEGGNEQRLEVLGSSSNEKGSVLVAASFRERSIIMAADRDYSSEGWSTSGNPGSFAALAKGDQKEDGSFDYKQKGGYLADPSCRNTGINLINQAGDNTYCQFNYAKTASIAPSINQLSLMAKMDHELSNSVTAYTLVKDSWRTSRWNYAPAPQTFDVTDPTAVAQIKQQLGVAGRNINLEAEDGVRIRYRTTELGTRNTEIQEKNTFGVLGLTGMLGEWDWDLSLAKGRTWRKEVGESGYWLVSNMQNLIKTGAYNPFDSQRDTAVLDSARHEPWSQEAADIQQVDFTLSGELFQLPAGSVGLAIGASHVEETYDISADSATINGFVAGSSGSLGAGQRDYQSAFAELNVPVTQAFELGLAGRFDQYSDVGSSSNPRLSMRYSLEQVMFRASAGTGFRAPSLQAINDAGGYGYPSFIDLVACDGARKRNNSGDIDFYCGQQQYLVETTAAENLKPEKTQFTNIGLVFDLGRSINGSLDAWNLEIKDRIGIADYQLLTQAELEGNRGYESAGIRIERANGEISSITMPNANLSKSEIGGIDLSLSSSFGNRQSLQVSWNHDSSYFLFYREAAFDGQDLQDRIGSVGRPQWKANNTISFTTLREHTLSAVARSTASTNKANSKLGKIPSHNEYDLQYNFSGFGNGSIALGAINVTNKKPPVDESQNPTVDVALYNNIGRSYYAKLTQNF